MNDSDLQQITSPEIFFKSKEKFPRTYYLHVRADLYLIVGSDTRDDREDFGFMKEVRLESDLTAPCTKREVMLYTEADQMVIEMLITGIFVHKGFI